MTEQITREKKETLTAEIEIRGIKPLLMSSTKEMYVTEGIESPYAARKFGKKIDPKVEAEKRAYRTEDHGWKGDLCVPAKCVHKLLEVTAKNPRFKSKRGNPSPAQAIKGSVEIIPEFIPLLDGKGKNVVKDYDVNIDTVIIQKSRIIRYRPEIRQWSLIFRVRWDPTLYDLSESKLKEIVAASGRIGLLDYRPNFGIFELVRFDIVEE
jgi:hypothetical protein